MSANAQKPNRTMELLYEDRDVSGDVTFLVESQRIQAHRIVLAATSPKYKAQFDKPDSNQDEIRVPNISAAAFNVFLQFFYKETVALTMDNIEMVLHLAKQSLVNEFVQSCLKFLEGAIRTCKDLCMAHRLAVLYGSKTIRLDCEERISTNPKYVFASAGFLCCDRDTLLHILKMETLNCKEKDVFAACIAWAREKCKRINLDPKKPENLRAALGDAVYQIRFSSLSTEEFADLHASMEGFFAADESIEILYIIGKLKRLKLRNFNQTARTPTSLEVFDEGNTVWSVEIDRLVRTDEKQSFESVAIRNFAFYSYNPIRLYGFALGVRFNQADQAKFPETLNSLVGQHSYQTRLPARYKIFQSPARHDETIIMLEKPIEQVKSFSCDFQLPAKELNYGLTLQPSVREHGVNIVFDCEWATRIFCDKIAGNNDFDDW